jgi:hypothetical protein
VLSTASLPFPSGNPEPAAVNPVTKITGISSACLRAKWRFISIWMLLSPQFATELIGEEID